MKRFLLCALLVINAVPAHAGDAANVLVGCVVLGTGGAYYMHEGFRNRVHGLWQQGNATGEQSSETGTKKIDEPYALPKKEEIEKDTAEVLQSNGEVTSIFKGRYNAGSKEADAADKDRLKKLETLLDTCGQNDQTQCKEAQILEDLIHKAHNDAIACASRSGRLVAQKAEKAQELALVTDQMMNGYQELKQIMQAEHDAIDLKYDEKKKKSAECLEQPSSECNQKVNELQAAIDQLSQRATERITSEGLKLGALNKRRQDLRNALKDFTEEQGIERAFPARFAQEVVSIVTQEIKSEPVASEPVQADQSAENRADEQEQNATVNSEAPEVNNTQVSSDISE